MSGTSESALEIFTCLNSTVLVWVLSGYCTTLPLEFKCCIAAVLNECTLHHHCLQSLIDHQDV